MTLATQVVEAWDALALSVTVLDAWDARTEGHDRLSWLTACAYRGERVRRGTADDLDLLIYRSWPRLGFVAWAVFGIHETLDKQGN